ncbi:ABC transporter permease [Sporohalobacter salinus]|uniref:ABC transporter permease n=1 Tax=Sporohalobacter salinus TaxID=1494606 RepID=UPI0019615EB1|nr:FtsX-like permease family protein [Sporohalobacter salinus]MBM7624734.1 putative ABC transport system permease protein [Sporohalobacter salinus]
MRKLKMFLRIVGKSFKERKSRVAIAFFAIVVGISVISALFNVYYDINIKMSQELRNYGANLIVKPSKQKQKEISEQDLNKVVSKFNDTELVGYRPNLYGIAKVKAKQVVYKSTKPVVLVGTWFDQIKKVNPYWKITGELPLDHSIADEVVIGKEVANKLNYGIGDKIKIITDKMWGEKELIVTAIVETGAKADNRVFVNLPVAQEVFAKSNQVSTAYFSILTKGKSLDQKVTALNKELTNVKLESIKKIASSEGKILNKIKSLMYLVVMIILASTLLCVSTTMMTIVTERKEEIALKKALGAENKQVSMEFLTEAAILGGIGGLVGYGLGFLGAQAIGKSVFDSYISFRPMIIPISFILSILVSCFASALPVQRVINIDPAVTLKGE